MGNIDESIMDFTRVLEIDPDHVNAAYARGACENRRGNFEKAIEDYQMALDKDRDRSSSPDRNWRRRLNKRDILLQRELSANKQKAENQLIRVQTMNSGGERLRPAMLQSINTEEDGMTQNRQINRQ